MRDMVAMKPRRSTIWAKSHERKNNSELPLGIGEHEANLFFLAHSCLFLKEFEPMPPNPEEILTNPTKSAEVLTSASLTRFK